MNKKVYYNSKYILITTGEFQQSGNQLIVNTSDLNADLLNEGINKFIQQNDGPDLILITQNTDSLFEEIKKYFTYIEAAGGLIEQNNKYLFIYRLKKWDLPKGKIDLGENPQQTAIRECEEECAITGLEIVKELPSTYHIYQYKTGFALKTIYWFLMKTTFSGQLIPQTTEYIEKAEWLDETRIKQDVIPNTYSSVLDLILVSIPH
ncbi:MAG TPA: NUDIX domain-containing protein [Bacteroidia bacterium]|jgi:8-oxo-dGTP pyrophosphatase MutT (NUDIX family)|nr:NUDIX domain-containing protein [Bacteroidia bacterium]